MQIHQLKGTNRKRSRRVGRGGKRGTFSGRGTKGQKARAGASQRPDFRGGDQPLWKVLPKLRGSTKKQEIKKRTFQLHQNKPAVVNFSRIDKYYKDGEIVSKLTLMQKGLISTGKNGVKILGTGDLKRKVTFDGVEFSKKAQERAVKMGIKLYSKDN